MLSAPASATDLDVHALEDWLRSASIGSGRLQGLRRLAGGTQNSNFRFTLGELDLVLRLPSSTRAGAADTVRREAAVLSALSDTCVPHPAFRGYCSDPEILGTPFLVMDEVKGFNAAVEMPGSAVHSASFRHSMGLGLVDAIAALAEVSPDKEGLSGIGQPEGFIERQVSRWAKQLQGYSSYTGWPGPQELGPVEEIGAWLEANRPSDYQPGLMHGDFHIGNVLFGYEGKVAAILDWELSTRGDPLLDLARLLTAWPDERNEGLLSLKVEPWGGFPTSEELVERYAAQTGRSLESLHWFKVLACYKYAIILEGSWARAAAGLSDRATAERLHNSARGLIALAVRLVNS